MSLLTNRQIITWLGVIFFCWLVFLLRSVLTPFLIASDVDTIYKSKINKASSANFSKQFICNKNASGGMYPITASVTYEYTANGEKQQGTAEFTFSIKVNSKKGSKKATALTPQLIVSSFNYGKTSISGGKQFTLSFNIKNNSPSIKAQNVLIKLESFSLLLSSC